MHEPNPNPVPPAALVITSGPQSGMQVAIRKQDFVIGRSPDCDLILESGSFPNEGIHITWSGSSYLLVDLTKNPAVLVNAHLPQFGIQALKDGDEIDLGMEVHLIFKRPTATAPLTPQTALDRAIRLARDGQRAEAEKWFKAATLDNPRNPQAWLGLSRTLEDPMKIRDCLVRVLRFDPSNIEALTRLRNYDHLQASLQKADLPAKPILPESSVNPLFPPAPLPAVADADEPPEAVLEPAPETKGVDLEQPTPIEDSPVPVSDTFVEFLAQNSQDLESPLDEKRVPHEQTSFHETLLDQPAEEVPPAWIDSLVEESAPDPSQPYAEMDQPQILDETLSGPPSWIDDLLPEEAPSTHLPTGEPEPSNDSSNQTPDGPPGWIDELMEEVSPPVSTSFIQPEPQDTSPIEPSPEEVFPSADQIPDGYATWIAQMAAEDKGSALPVVDEFPHPVMAQAGVGIEALPAEQVSEDLSAWLETVAVDDASGPAEKQDLPEITEDLSLTTGELPPASPGIAEPEVPVVLDTQPDEVHHEQQTMITPVDEQMTPSGLSDWLSALADESPQPGDPRPAADPLLQSTASAANTAIPLADLPDRYSAWLDSIEAIPVETQEAEPAMSDSGPKSADLADEEDLSAWLAELSVDDFANEAMLPTASSADQEGTANTTSQDAIPDGLEEFLSSFEVEDTQSVTPDLSALVSSATPAIGAEPPSGGSIETIAAEQPDIQSETVESPQSLEEHPADAQPAQPTLEVQTYPETNEPSALPAWLDNLIENDPELEEAKTNLSPAIPLEPDPRSNQQNVAPALAAPPAQTPQFPYILVYNKWNGSAIEIFNDSVLLWKLERPSQNSGDARIMAPASKDEFLIQQLSANQEGKMWRVSRSPGDEIGEICYWTQTEQWVFEYFPENFSTTFKFFKKEGAIYAMAKAADFKAGAYSFIVKNEFPLQVEFDRNPTLEIMTQGIEQFLMIGWIFIAAGFDSPEYFSRKWGLK